MLWGCFHCGNRVIEALKKLNSQCICNFYFVFYFFLQQLSKKSTFKKIYELFFLHEEKPQQTTQACKHDEELQHASIGTLTPWT